MEGEKLTVGFRFEEMQFLAFSCLHQESISCNDSPVVMCIFSLTNYGAGLFTLLLSLREGFWDSE